MYFKSDYHKEEYYRLLKSFPDVVVNGEENEFRFDRYIHSFCYLIAGIYKVNIFAKCIDDGYLDMDEIYKHLGYFSTTENRMANFALQCFNPSLSEIDLPSVFHGLDDENEQMILQAIQLRYVRVNKC